jgi:hypothetical protein
MGRNRPRIDRTRTAFTTADPAGCAPWVGQFALRQARVSATMVDVPRTVHCDLDGRIALGGYNRHSSGGDEWTEMIELFAARKSLLAAALAHKGRPGRAPRRAWCQLPWAPTRCSGGAPWPLCAGPGCSVLGPCMVAAVDLKERTEASPAQAQLLHATSCLARHSKAVRRKPRRVSTYTTIPCGSRGFS